ncbi:MAG: hypothetical protein IT445_10640 [Phycisphaeraceae bacterium]|nr:hypothetical protein [Phycisphaeraceae bacterium]
MLPWPRAAETLDWSFSVAFSEPTFQRAVVLMIGSILARGRRTATNMLWTVGALAGFFHRHRRHVTLVSRCHPEAALYRPPTRQRIGRPRIKGKKLPSPRQTVARRRRGKRAGAIWSGGCCGSRRFSNSRIYTRGIKNSRPRCAAPCSTRSAERREGRRKRQKSSLAV